MSAPHFQHALLWLLAWPGCALGLEFTHNEAEFLRAHPVWRLAGASTPPFQWRDEKGGFHGMAQDYRAIIERELGVRLEPVAAPTWDASLEQLRRRECDISLLTSDTPEREEFLGFTQPLLALPLAIITRRGTADVKGLDALAGRRVAVGRHWPIHERLRQAYPNIVLIPRDDVGSALSAVALGDAEAYVGDLASATQAIDRLGVPNLKVAGELASLFPFRIGVRKDWPEALALLDKVIAEIPPAEHAAIRRRWITVQGFGWPSSSVIILVGLAAVGVVALTLGFANRRLAREVLQRRETEAALRESEERWGFALDGSRDGVWDWNVQTNEVFFSKRFRSMLNFSEAEMPGRFEEWTSRIHPDDLDSVLHEVQRHLRGDTRAYEVEHRVATKGSSYRWILARGRVVSHDAAGAPLRMVGTHTDITERRRAEDALRGHQEKLEETVRTRTAELAQAERRLRQITDTMPGAVYQLVRLAHGELVFTFCSEGMEAMVGVPGEEAVRNAEAVWAVIHPQDLALLRAKAEHSAATLTHYSQDLRVCQPDGRTWWIQAESVPQREPDGTTVWNGNIFNITERKRLQEELAQARRVADSANRAKSAFLANMSHEIRTPMNAVLGFSQLLMRDPTVTGAQRHHLDTINRSGEHLLAVINDILEISRIESGRLSLQMASFDLHALLEDVDRIFRLRAQGRGLRFIIERAESVPRFARADEGKLRQILLNLIGNSVKFTERGSIVLRLAAELRPGTALRLSGEVEDTGPGIAPADLPRLFQQFEQTETGRRAGVGTGLGLAISREFARLMGGDLRAASAPGRGTTFHFEIMAEQCAPLLRAHHGHRRVLRLAPGQPAVRVLIADDVAENRELLERILQPAGFETRSVADGLSAVEVLAEWRPHVALFDLRMSGLDGFEAMRRVRALPAGARTPIIAVTASAFEEDRRDVIAAGGDDFLGKPFRDRDLFEKIGRLAGVEYLYEESAAAPPGEFTPLSPEQVAAALPATLRARLREAALRADFDQMVALLEEAGAGAPEIAAELRGRVERFEYQALLVLLEGENFVL